MTPRELQENAGGVDGFQAVTADGVRKAVRERQAALADLVHGIRAFRHVDERPLNKQDSGYAQVLHEPVGDRSGGRIAAVIARLKSQKLSNSVGACQPTQRIPQGCRVLGMSSTVVFVLVVVWPLVVDYESQGHQSFLPTKVGQALRPCGDNGLGSSSILPKDRLSIMMGSNAPSFLPM
jgi:hypothetical protein